MSYAKEYNYTPISDSTPEFHFGQSTPVSMWIEFQKSDFSLWRGSFECGESKARKIIGQEGNEFIIIADGNGYRIDNDNHLLKSKIDLDNIIFGAKINDKECLLANWTGFYILNSENELTQLKNLNSLEWIELDEENDNRLSGKLDSSRYQWKTRTFVFDKKNKKLKI